ncbi:hypothetical protein PUR57_04590 [Streptomyces sp. JV176]|uniref:hypothetical protein n=1 Tax=Streptomyces sp. JV176 TaxID=858630 RepID=UPI002E76F1BF|nr:hypothetical protein [Streptomyces sp. JV176]MEE1797966.1 hypothetical protein [Streptomyces sp. JV176]
MPSEHTHKPCETSETAPFEGELGEALHRTGRGFTPVDRAALVDAGLRRGRRRLARRRIAVVTGGALVLGTVGLGGMYGDRLPGGTAADSTTASGAATATAGPRALVTGARAASGGGLTGALARLLPEGELSDAAESRNGGAAVRGVFDDGEGRAEVSVGLSRVNATEAGDQVTCPARAYTPYDSCDTTELTDGSQLMILQGYVYPDRREDTKNWRAVLLTSDGFLVDASEYNAPAEKGAEISRPDPPLDRARLKALVTSDEWRGTAARLPAPPRGRGPGGGGGDDGGSAGRGDVHVGTVFASLLPAGLKVYDQGRQENEFAYAVVDDGKGRGLVQINVQPGMSGTVGELFGGATTLPDGTQVKATKQRGEKGGAGVVQWTVDTIRPDGLRVVVSAFNSGAQNTPATRATPALTLEQLTAIATSEKWLG